MSRRLLSLCCSWLFALMLVGFAQAAPYQIGVYYYPGWSPETKGPGTPDTWNDIRRFPEREPEMGWYRDDKRATLDKQLAWMADHAIDFTVFDWYWENGKPAKETSVRAYLESDQRKRVKYALLWANHTREPRSLAEWDALSDFWIANHLKNPEYLQVDGKPVLFVFSPDLLQAQAKVVGKPVKELLDRTREKAKSAGLAGVYFVLAVPASEFWVKQYAPAAGFDALSAYNYHFGMAGQQGKAVRLSESFEELDQAYRMQWNWITSNSKLPYIVPMMSGWDKRPWGGSRQASHDNSVSTPDSFETHLRAAKSLMDAKPEQTLRMGVICCWNEYGEGSVIEPTKRYGRQYIERVKRVFGGR